MVVLNFLITQAGKSALTYLKEVNKGGGAP